MELKLAFVGFGGVARAFARLLGRQSNRLADEYGIRWRTTAIATANHGSVVSDTDLDLQEAIIRVESGHHLVGLAGSNRAIDATRVVEYCHADVLFETTPLNPASGEPATSYIRRALSRKINVVTANKGPIAFAYNELAALARSGGVSFRFEGVVMDGAPVFNLAEYCLPADRVLEFCGVLNSTTTFILSGMESGLSFERCLDEARRLGIAEVNADYDIDGWDAAIKALALAKVLMGAEVLPHEVERTGIRNISGEALKRAVADGKAVRLIARARQTRSGLRISVAPEAVPITSPLGSVRGTSSALVIRTELMGEIALVETDPGIEQTAYALLSDMIRIHHALLIAGHSQGASPS